MAASSHHGSISVNPHDVMGLLKFAAPLSASEQAALREEITREAVNETDEPAGGGLLRGSHREGGHVESKLKREGPDDGDDPGGERVYVPVRS